VSMDTIASIYKYWLCYTKQLRPSHTSPQRITHSAKSMQADRGKYSPNRDVTKDVTALFHVFC